MKRIILCFALLCPVGCATVNAPAKAKCPASCPNCPDCSKDSCKDCHPK